MAELDITTNNVPRDVLDAWELTPSEREEFDYHDWQAIEEGQDSASFFRYRGELYDLGEFERAPSALCHDGQWDQYSADTFFSGILVRFPRGQAWNGEETLDTERVIVGRYFAR